MQGENDMNYKSAKALSAYASGIQVLTIIITYLLYANQKTVKTFLSGAEEIRKVHSVPIDYFIVCICPAILYFGFVGFQAYAERMDGGRKSGGIFFFVVACIMEIVLGFVPGVGNMLLAQKGVGELASHSMLGSVISKCTSPFAIVAFGLFALSAGGCIFGVKEQKTSNYYDGYSM